MYSHEIEVLIGKVAKMCYKINAETIASIFFHYSGHVNNIDIYYFKNGYSIADNQEYIAFCKDATVINLRHTLQELTKLYTKLKTEEVSAN